MQSNNLIERAIEGQDALFLWENRANRQPCRVPCRPVVMEKVDAQLCADGNGKTDVGLWPINRYTHLALASMRRDAGAHLELNFFVVTDYTLSHDRDQGY
jgi:hypothetical protein